MSTRMTSELRPNDRAWIPHMGQWRTVKSVEATDLHNIKGNALMVVRFVESDVPAFAVARGAIWNKGGAFPFFCEAVELAKREIAEDIARGVLPPWIEDFETMQDFVDANMYGGLCDPALPQSEWPLAEQPVINFQEVVDEWMRAGRPTDAERQFQWLAR